MLVENMMEPREEHTNVHSFLSQTSYKNVIAFSLITAFFLLFHIIYLALEAFGISKNVRLGHAARVCAKSERARHARRKKSSADVEPTPSDLRQQRLVDMEMALWSNRNLEVSFIHSVLCSAWLIHVCLYNDNIFNDLFSYVSWDTYLLVAFSCGYFVYDFYDIVSNGQLKEQSAVCLHHFIVLICFTYNMIYLCNIGYTTLALIMEFNSVFLHARKLLNFYDVDKKSLIVRVNTAFNLLTFTVFRFGVLHMIVSGIIYDGHRVTLPYLYMLAVCTFAMTGINLVLYYRLLKKDIFPIFKKHHHHHHHHHHHDDTKVVEEILEAQRQATLKPLTLKNGAPNDSDKIYIAEVDAVSPPEFAAKKQF